MTAGAAAAVSLRPAGAADRAFLLAVYASTRVEELAQVAWSDAEKRAFVEQQFDAQDTEYRRTRPDATFEVILVGDEPAGRLYLERTPNRIHVIDIALLPPFRGRGVGTRLLEDLAAEADATGRALSIYVERFNPARRLYERLGLRELEAGPVYVLMERPAAALS